MDSRDHERIGNVDYPPHDCGRHERYAVLYHALCKLAVVAERSVLPEQSGSPGQEYDGDHVAEGNGKHVTHNSQMEHTKEQDIQQDNHDGGKGAVDGVQPDSSPRPHVDGAYSLDASRCNVHINEPLISAEHVDHSDQRNERREYHQPDQSHVYAYREDVVLLSYGIVQSIAKHTLVYRERHHRYQQCRGVYNVVDIAESVRAEPARIKTKHDIHEELRAKLPQRQNKGVACQLLVLIHADILSL